MKYKVRFIKDSERSDVSFVFEETELEAEDEAAARVAYEAAKSSAPGGALAGHCAQLSGHHVY